MSNGLLWASANVVKRNKRYIVWFYLLNLLLAWFGAAAFSAHAHAILDHSLYADKLLHGFDVTVLVEMIIRPEFGPIQSSTVPARVCAILFFLASRLCMPGVLLGYSSDHRILREEFYRACGHNVWRFVRLFVLNVVIAGIVAVILFGVHAALVNAVDNAANDDRLLFLTRILTLVITFLILTAIRAWFDLAQADVVLRDQNAVRKSVAWASRITRQNFRRLLATYVALAIVASVILTVGILIWHAIVPPPSAFAAFLVSQIILLLLLAMRFWQRAAAVAVYLQQGSEPAFEVRATPLAASPVVSGL